MLLAACSAGREHSSDTRQEHGSAAARDEQRKEGPTSPRLAVPQGTKVIDQANVLSPAEKVSLDERVARVAGRIGRKTTVVLLRPAGGQSLEMVAWAIAPKAEPNGPVLLVVDVESGSVRVDGDVDPERGAAIARAIGAEVRGGRVASGISRGLDQVANLERHAA